MLIDQSKQVYSQWKMPQTQAGSALEFNNHKTQQDTVALSAEGKNLQQGGNSAPAEHHTYSKPQPQQEDNIEKLRNPEQPEPGFLEKALQYAVDRRVGIDREKLEEIEEKIREIEKAEDAIRNDDSIPKQQKEVLLKGLAEEKAKLLDMLEAEKKRMAEAAAEEEKQKESNSTSSII